MDYIVELIFAVSEICITAILPYIFENILWNKDLPKTIEEFDKLYEYKINRILSDNTNKSSDLLEKIITDNIDLHDESESSKYSSLLKMHEELLIHIKFHVEMENVHKEIRQLYHSLHITIRNIRNLAILVIVFYVICGILYGVGYFYQFQLFILCGIYSLSFYSIFRISALYFKFNRDWNDLIHLKKRITTKYDNIPKLIGD